jgi:8-oxo-dGTP pyrophosphatase MutT (NUDIX family)
MAASALGTEHSAGGVIVRKGACVVIVPTRRTASGAKVLSLPKGHVDPGETPAQAAVREVREEGGVDGQIVAPLGDVRYVYIRGGNRIAKVVEFFLLDYVRGDVAEHDHEVEVARWMPLKEAIRRLTYRGEREMVTLALSHRRGDE